MEIEKERTTKEGGGQQTEDKEKVATVRIYVASLSDYNAGRLHGVWLDASGDVTKVREDVDAMLKSSKEANAEEYAIHDYEGFSPLQLGESESLDTVVRVAQGIAKHGPAFAHWASIVGTHDIEGLERFEDAYCGWAESLEAYAEELIEEFGYGDDSDFVEASVPDSLRPYVHFDVEGFARDLELGGELTFSRGNDGVYVFDPR